MVCSSNKVQYPTPKVARDYAKLLGAKHGKSYKIYPCNVCKNWHLKTSVQITQSLKESAVVADNNQTIKGGLDVSNL